MDEYNDLPREEGPAGPEGQELEAQAAEEEEEPR